MRTWSLNQRPSIKMAMTPFPYSIDIEAPLERAMAMMTEHDIRHLPVKEGGRLVGIVTDRDVKMVLDTRIGPRWDRELKVRNACLPDAYVVDISTPLESVLFDMMHKHIGSALVLKDGNLVGIFTAYDACRALGELLHTIFPPDGGNEAA